MNDLTFLKTLIHDSMKNFKPCEHSNCSCYIPVIEKDLDPFQQGISQKMIYSVKDRYILLYT